MTPNELVAAIYEQGWSHEIRPKLDDRHELSGSLVIIHTNIRGEWMEFVPRDDIRRTVGQILLDTLERGYLELMRKA